MKTRLAFARAILAAIGDRAYSQTKSPGTPQTDSIRANKIITEADCTAARLGTNIPIAAIGEPVSAVADLANRQDVLSRLEVGCDKEMVEKHMAGRCCAEASYTSGSSRRIRRICEFSGQGVEARVGHLKLRRAIQTGLNPLRD